MATGDMAIGDTAIRLRTMTAADIPAGLELCRAARWNQIESDWRRFLALNPVGARVAVETDDAVIGSVATLRYHGAGEASLAEATSGVSFTGQRGRSNNITVGHGGFDWLAMVLVAPAYRRHGIASRLVEEAIALLGAGAPVRLDATPAGELVYRKLGFVPEYELARMVRPPLPAVSAGSDVSGMSGVSAEAVSRLAGRTGGLSPDDAAYGLATTDSAAKHAAAMLPGDEHVRAMDDEDVAEVLSLDRDVFGADRAALLRMLRQDVPGYAIVDRRGSRLGGYAFGRHGFSFAQLGPIVARDETAARRLVGHVVASHPRVAFLLDVPRRSATWVAWLGEIGFREQRGFVRLVRGAPAGFVATDSEPRLFATIGADFG